MKNYLNEYFFRHKLFEPIVNTFDVTCVRFKVHSFAAQLLQQKYRSAIKITKWFIFMTFCTFYVNIFRIFYMPSDRCCAVQTVASYFIRISYWLCYNMNPTKWPKSLWRHKKSPEKTNTNPLFNQYPENWFETILIPENCKRNCNWWFLMIFNDFFYSMRQ